MINTIIFFCSVCQLYSIITIFNQNKPRVIVSLFNSVFLSCLSISTFYTVIDEQNPESIVKSFISTPEQKWLADYIMGYFAADLFLGHVFDRANINILSGYIHHTVFIGLAYYVKETDQSNIIYLLLPFEIPTALLDIKRLYKDEMLDLLFGVSFLTFRIAYHIYVIFLLSLYYPPYAGVASTLLIAHLYWFRQWIRKTNFTPIE